MSNSSRRKIYSSNQSYKSKDSQLNAIELSAQDVFTQIDQLELPEYEKIKTVGQGSFGMAVLYRRRRDRNLVVLKQINLSNLTRSERELAMNEAEVFSKLHHPNIICYLGSFIRGDILLIEMEYADGGTLAKILAEKNPGDFMAERHVLRILEQITSAISYMHSENILHRDLKTANVFLNNRGTVKLGDFGISKIMSTNIQAQTVLGTPYYFSPEMCEGKDYDTKSDIWALGCVLGEMCCLQKAFAANNLSELVGKIMSAQYLALPSGYSDGLRSLIKILLQVDQTQRPTALEVLQYWIPLVYRSISKNRGYTYNNNETSTYNSLRIPSGPLEESKEQYIEASTTVALNGPRIERSVLYEMKSFGNNTFLTPLQLPPAIRISLVATNGVHFLAVTIEGLVYSWGEGNVGQLGHGTAELWKHYPIKIESIKKYKIVGACAGDGFSIFWTDLGVVLSCGDNSKHCLGHDHNIKTLHEPKTIENLNGIRIIQVACGTEHVVALCSNNFLYSWGMSENGALGMGNQITVISTPLRVSSILFNKGIGSIICGKDCSMILLKNGDILASGKNTDNRLGLGKKVQKSMTYKKISEITKQVKEVSISSNHSVFLMESGYVVTLGKNVHGQRGLGHCRKIEYPTLVTGIKDKFITKASCSSTYSVVFSDDNIVTFWGTRSGLPDDQEHNSVSQELKVESLQLKESNTDFGNSTVAFTNFLASVYKSELILDPTDVLALYSSDEQLAKGYYIKLSNIYPLHHSILVLVDTTTPLVTNGK